MNCATCGQPLKVYPRLIDGEEAYYPCEDCSKGRTGAPLAQGLSETRVREIVREEMMKPGWMPKPKKEKLAPGSGRKLIVVALVSVLVALGVSVTLFLPGFWQGFPTFLRHLVP